LGGPGPLKQPVDEARKLLLNGRRPPSYADAIENDTAAAEQLWTAAAQSCAMPPRDGPLSRIMARLIVR